MATITLYELSSYNNGELYAETFDLASIDDNIDFEAAVSQWLGDLWEGHKEAGLVDADQDSPYEEWIVADAEEVPDSFVGEYSFDADAWGEYKAACEDMGLEIVNAFIACFGEWESLSSIQDRYMGHYESPYDFGYEMLEGCLDRIPQELHGYIDFEQYTRDQELSGYIAEHEGHYFHNC